MAVIFMRSKLSSTNNKTVQNFQYKYFDNFWWQPNLCYKLTAVLNLGVFNGPKKNSNFAQFIQRLPSTGRQTFAIGLSGDRVQVWLQVQASAGHLAITPKGYSRLRRQSKVLTAKSMAKLLGQGSCTAWAGQHNYRAFLSLQQSLWTATCSLEENMLPKPTTRAY